MVRTPRLSTEAKILRIQYGTTRNEMSVSSACQNVLEGTDVDNTSKKITGYAPAWCIYWDELTRSFPPIPHVEPINSPLAAVLELQEGLRSLGPNNVSIYSLKF